MLQALGSRPNERSGGLEVALASCRRVLAGVAAISVVINILYLTGSFFMLEVYDRVIPSRSLPTLVAIGLLAAALYLCQGLLDVIRSRIFVRLGNYLDSAINQQVFQAIEHLSLVQRRIDPLQPGRDLDQIRSFLSSGGPVAFFDLPWLPFYILLCFLFHPWIGVAAVLGSLILIAITFMTERGTSEPSRAAVGHATKRAAMAEAAHRNAEVVRALGMGRRLAERWNVNNSDYVRETSRASDVALGLGAMSKVLRMAIQSGVLALGAYLVIMGQATAGVMIASSILVARALAPVELAIGNWKGFVAARQSWRRLTIVLADLPSREMMELPAPSRGVDVRNLHLVAPGDNRIIVADVSFRLPAGSAMGIIGSSASGKSSLARGLVGVWPAARGEVRFDGASITNWSAERLGRHIGYLPQNVELFAGTVAENIARFTPDFLAEDVIAAATAAGVHEMILRLPEGYDSQIGDQGSALSAGQRQRIALARALFGNPFVVVLDEPNSNLDAEGDAALTAAVLSVRARGGIVVVIAHRPSAIKGCDWLLMMRDGRSLMFDLTDRVLASFAKPNGQAAVSEAVAPATLSSQPG